MKWQDKGFLLSSSKYNENSAIVEFFTENYGKKSGVIFGASSKKIKNYLIVGNKFHLNFNSKNDSKIGYFKVEIDKINTPIHFDNKKKLFCIIYTMNIIKILTMENEVNINIFKLINNFFSILYDDNWLTSFIFWELNFYKCIGYDIDFKNYVKNVIIDGDEKFIVESNNKIIPNFLINNDIYVKNPKDIISGFKIVGEFLDKTILKPNNINFPSSRIELANLIKRI